MADSIAQVNRQHIQYMPHAIARMEFRGITEADVEYTLSNPDRQWPALRRDHPCTVSIRRIGERICKVYVRDGSDPPVIATVAWHGEPDRR